MFNSQKSLNKENTLDSDFAHTIRQICLRKNVSVEKFIKGMDQPYETAKKMFYGKHPWMGYTTFRELERLTGTTPGYIEELYRNIKERSA